MTTTLTRIQPKRDTAANWTTANPVLLAGETGYETDTKKAKRGDGTTAWTALPYQAPDAVALAAAYVHYDGTHLTQAGTVIPISGSGTAVALDTDGVPYYSTTGTASLAVDTDGVPYLA